MKSLYVVTLLFSLSFYAQEKKPNSFPPPQVPIEIKATKASGKITIDGKLDESDWKNTTPITDFFRVEPVQGGMIKKPNSSTCAF